MGRPVGEVAQALVQAASERPGTVRELAARARVGVRLAWEAARRARERGELVVVLGSRPTVLTAPACELVCLLDGATHAQAEPHGLRQAA